jgi:hypothetical protein
MHAPHLQAAPTNSAACSCTITLELLLNVVALTQQQT